MVRLRVRRAYEAPGPQDGCRVLVDRLWPRGVRKDALSLDEWLRDVAPSAELRTWYGHDPAKFEEFRRRYAIELAGASGRAAFGRLRTLAAGGPLTLVTATKDTEHSQAAVLAGLLEAGEAGQAGDATDAGGGDAACWANLICPECGAIASEGHRAGCSAGPSASRSGGAG